MKGIKWINRYAEKVLLVFMLIAMLIIMVAQRHGRRNLRDICSYGQDF